MSAKHAVVAAVVAASLLVPATGLAGEGARRVRIIDEGPNRFAPRTLTVDRGDRVRWVNRGSLSHTTTSDAGLWNRQLSPGGAFSRVFRRRGTFEYHCSIHPAMTATIVVE